MSVVISRFSQLWMFSLYAPDGPFEPVIQEAIDWEYKVNVIRFQTTEVKFDSFDLYSSCKAGNPFNQPAFRCR